MSIQIHYNTKHDDDSQALKKHVISTIYTRKSIGYISALHLVQDDRKLF